MTCAVSRGCGRAPLALPLDGDQDDGVAPLLERFPVRQVVREAAVAVALAVDVRRVGIERGHVVGREEEGEGVLERPRVEEGAPAVAQAGDADPQRRSLRRWSRSAPT